MVMGLVICDCRIILLLWNTMEHTNRNDSVEVVTTLLLRAVLSLVELRPSKFYPIEVSPALRCTVDLGAGSAEPCDVDARIHRILLCNNASR